ncbi:MAG: DUF1835 domain-containing protein [Oscillospiraceae bacterium]|nr:DUF1835 domain-containing protein [Oscillospiraceae bacterium]
MIEILFGDSESGAMKFALKTGNKSGKDVICLNFMLDIGELRQPVLSKYRSNLIYRMLYQEQWGADPEMEAELKDLGKIYAKELARLKKHLKNGEQLRIWYSSCPYSMCGFLWLCNALSTVKNDIFAVKLPSSDPHVSWGELEPHEFVKYLKFQRKLPPAELQRRAFEWNRLRKENAPLRAVINGSVISVPSNFYDFLIRKHLGKTPKKEAVLIGEILGNNKIGVGDWWFASRIERFIRLGKIKIIEDSEQKYARIIKRNF